MIIKITWVYSSFMCANLKYGCTQCTKVNGKSYMVLRTLSGLVGFTSRVVPLFTMPIMHMFNSNQSLFIGPSDPRTSPMSGDQKGPYKTQNPGTRRADWWGEATGDIGSVGFVSSS